MEEFLKSINIYDYKKFRDAVIKKCNVSRATWSYWTNGKHVPDRKYQAIIDEIALYMFGRMIFDKTERREDHDPMPFE